MHSKTDSPGKQALDRFLGITDRERQYRVLREMGVTSPDDEQTPDVYRVFQQALRKIAAQGMQVVFWDKMNEVLDSIDENPFIYRDMLTAIESDSQDQQHLHCPKCGMVYYYRRESAVSICRNGMCRKCKAKSCEDGMPCITESLDKARERGESPIAQQMEAFMQTWQPFGYVTPDEALEAIEKAEQAGFSKGAFNQMCRKSASNKVCHNRGPESNAERLADAVSVLYDYHSYNLLTDEARAEAEELMHKLRVLLSPPSIPPEMIKDHEPSNYDNYSASKQPRNITDINIQQLYELLKQKFEAKKGPYSNGGYITWQVDLVDDNRVNVYCLNGKIRLNVTVYDIGPDGKIRSIDAGCSRVEKASKMTVDQIYAGKAGQLIKSVSVNEL